MAISVTELLGTDSLSGSRLVLNDNFNILTSEINAFEVYINPTAGTILNINNLQTEALRVGLSTILLDINASTFDILTNVNMTGNLNLNGGGLFRNDVNVTTLNTAAAGGTSTIDVGGTGTIPGASIYRVGSDTATTLNLRVFDGAIGQEIFFTYSEAQTGTVSIVGANTPLVLPGTAPSNTKINLAAIGQTAHLLCVDDGTGNGVWFLVGGAEYTIA
tara:strand:+ start:522 stop:1175 length:654 start_codon:yes stop_codon:yes gene_type:complete